MNEVSQRDGRCEGPRDRELVEGVKMLERTESSGRRALPMVFVQNFHLERTQPRKEARIPVDLCPKNDGHLTRTLRKSDFLHIANRAKEGSERFRMSCFLLFSFPALDVKVLEIHTLDVNDQCRITSDGAVEETE